MNSHRRKEKTINRTDVDDDGDGVEEHERSLGIFEERESNVRSYSRSFPTVFTSASGAILRDAQGRSYIDFFAGAGSLNYGHNHPLIRDALVEYLQADGIAHGLDMYTAAKRSFLESFTDRILKPRNLDHRVQFVGPTGTNAVEAALKITRKATRRSGVLAFMGAYHGHSLGSLSVTSNRDHRASAGTTMGDVTFVPFGETRGLLQGIDTLSYLRHVVTNSHSGSELPAAIILETVQAEGGINVAPISWLRGIRQICDEFGILLIVDEIQTGCGRTGSFFSFERADIVPDIITLSKSISGFGLPMALTLLRPAIDRWQPGEHTGTFRGNQHAFITATVALELFESTEFQHALQDNSEMLARRLARIVAEADDRIQLRGLGMLWGVDLGPLDDSGTLTAAVARRCFENGLVIETAGSNSTVLKFLPPLNIDPDQLEAGLVIFDKALKANLN